MAESSGVLFEKLLEVMRRLRGPGGCPWDRAQTPTSLKPYLVEEAYEVLEAIESGRAAALREELGDLLLQVVFHAQISTEHAEFTMADVLRQVVDKLVHRHPHVFADATASTPRQALAQWESIKQREAEVSGRQRSVLEGVPRSLPALLRAQRIQTKAARVNFDWPDATGAWVKVEEEVRECAAALTSGDRARLEEELGDALFSLVNVARLADLDAEDALQRSVEKFRRRFSSMEVELRTRGTSVTDASADELERAWESAKAAERQP